MTGPLGLRVSTATSCRSSSTRYGRKPGHRVDHRLERHRRDRRREGSDPQPRIRRAERFRNRSEKEFAGYRAALDYLHQESPGDVHGRAGSAPAPACSSPSPTGEAAPSRPTTTSSSTATRTAAPPCGSSQCRAGNTLLHGGTHRPHGRRARRRHASSAAGYGGVRPRSPLHPPVRGRKRARRPPGNDAPADRGLVTASVATSASNSSSTTPRTTTTAALAASTDGWFDDGHHDLWPWATYFLNRLDEAYERFGVRESRPLRRAGRSRIESATAYSCTRPQRSQSRTSAARSQVCLITRSDSSSPN